MNILKQTFGNEGRWVNWRPLIIEGKTTKVPYAVDGRRSSTVDPKTWSTYEEVKTISEKVGIIFTPDKKLLGIDIDHCVENRIIIHEQRDDIQRFIKEADTYCEISPSNAGLHLFLRVTEAFTLVVHKKAPYELYSSGRYFTVTNNSFGEAKPVRTVTPDQANELLKIIGYPWQKQEKKETDRAEKSVSLDDASILEKMFESKNGNTIKVLYNGDTSAYENDESRADMALCSHLAFWTAKDVAQMERLWLASPLGNREKTKKRKDYRSLTIQNAINGCNDIYQEETESRGINWSDAKGSMATKILKTILARNDVTLFHDDQGEAHISLDINGSQQIWPCKSRAVKKWLSGEIYRVEKKASNTETSKGIISVLESKACFEGLKIILHNRNAWLNDDLWCDLTNEKWQAVMINKDNWEVVDKPPTLFKRYSHHKSQIMPARGGNIKLFLNHVNINDEQEKLLLLVYLVTCFIPGFAHPILIISGPQGSAKSLLSKLLRWVIDPSLIEVSSMPENQRELIQTLAHHAFLFFDNVSYISETTSDTLCKAVTGSGFPKRELYSDDDDFIYSFKRCIGINGINNVATRPDLLERSIILELEQIDQKNRKLEKEIIDSFQSDLPIILGGVFDVLAKAISIKQTLKINSLPRMADFTLWGCAIAEALGYNKEDFRKAYQDNIKKQTEVALNENIVATALISFMESRENWEGTATELLNQLDTLGSFDFYTKYEKYWPKSSNALTRRLNELVVALKNGGISYICIPGKSRKIILRKIVKNDGDDDTDDISLKLPRQEVLK